VLLKLQSHFAYLAVAARSKYWGKHKKPLAFLNRSHVSFGTANLQCKLEKEIDCKFLSDVFAPQPESLFTPLRAVKLSQDRPKIQDMHGLLNLPEAFLIGLLTDWLSLAALLALDSACCSASSRKTYLGLVGSNVFCLRHAPHPYRLRTNGMRWFIARNVRVSHAWIHESTNVNLATTAAFLRVSGSSLKDFWMSGFKESARITAILELLSEFVLRLEKLLLIRCVQVDCSVLLSYCSHSVQSLRLLTCSLTAPLSATMLPKLYKLSIYQCEGTELTTLCKLVSACPNLRSFRCDNIQGGDDCLDALAAHCPLLQVLAYENGDPSDVSSLVRVFQCCPGIEVVDISTDKDQENPSATDAHVAAIMQHCRKLKAFCGPASGPNITDASVMAVASRLEDLRHLWLSDIAFQSDQPMLALSEHCRNLRTLSLHMDEAILSDSALVTLVTNLHSIEELGMEYITLTDRALEAVAAHCPHLQILDLYNCDGYTEVGITALARGCTALRKISTCADEQFTNPTVRLRWQQLRPGLKFYHDDSLPNFWNRLHDFRIDEMVIW
jgi:hypothetical protein